MKPRNVDELVRALLMPKKNDEGISKSKRLRELIATGPVMLPGVPTLRSRGRRSALALMPYTSAARESRTPPLAFRHWVAVDDGGRRPARRVCCKCGSNSGNCRCGQPVSVARRTSRARFVNWKRQAWPVATLKIRNFPSAVDISQANQ